MNVLYADDCSTNRSLLTRMISSQGGIVTAVDDGDRVAAALHAAGMLTPQQVELLRAVGLPCVGVGASPHVGGAGGGGGVEGGGGGTDTAPPAARARVAAPFDAVVLDM